MKHITPEFYVTEQLALEDIPALAEAGICHIICNRPDHEAEGQVNSDAVQVAAKNAGIEFHHLATAPGQFPQALVDQFAELVAGLDGKALAYCRTGTRSLSLWTLANPERKSAEELLQLAEAAGYNMSGLIDRAAV